MFHRFNVYCYYGWFCAIDDTSATVKFEALKDELKEATIEVKDNKGNVVEVKPVNLVKGETVATFIFKTKLEKAPEGIWTVEGIEYDLDLIKNVNAFIVATTQIEINKALTDLGIKNVKVENMPLYETEKVKWNKEYKTATVKDIQKFVDDANKKAVEGEASQEEAKKIIEAAKGTNDIVYAEAMKSESLERVNPDWIADYRADIKTLDEKTSKVENIQAKINAKNTEKLSGLTAGIELDKDKLNKEKALLENYTEPEKDGKLPAATLTEIQKYDIQLALADLNTAKTAALFRSYYSKLVTVVDNEVTLSMEDFVEDNAALYVEELATLVGASTPVDKVTDVTTKIIRKINNAVKDNVLKAINKAATAADDETADDLLKALKDAEIKGVEDANKDKYFEAKSDFVTASDDSTGSIDLVTAEVKKVNDAVKVDALVKIIKESKDVAETEEALVALANLGKVANFLNTPKADRTFVAGELVAVKDRTTVDSEDGINTAVGTANTTITTALGAVNVLTNVSVEADVITALEKIKVFDDLSAIAKKDVANKFIEEVLEVLEEATDTPNFKSYTELSNFVEGLI